MRSAGTVAIVLATAAAAACDGRSAGLAVAARDDAGPGALGEPIPGLNGVEHSRFTRGRFWFEWFFVPGEGLGPVFNEVSCVACHGVPVSGGGHPVIGETRFRTSTTLQHPAPLVDQADGAPQLSTHSVTEQFFTEGCAFESEYLPDSTVAVSGRVTPLLFGAGLIEAIDDATLIENGMAASRENAEVSGVAALNPGEVNTQVSVSPVMVPVSPTKMVARFGVRGLTASLQEFTHGALFNELGMTTAHPKYEVDPRPMGMPAPADCKRKTDPELDPLEVQAITDFVRFLAPPSRRPVTPAGGAGEDTFTEIGCASCHTPVLMTGDSPVAALANREVPLFSDLLLHDMGAELADAVLDGPGTESEWRTPPLWGFGLAVKPLMHDGRAGRDVFEAIRLHGGEAAGARARFFALSDERKLQLVEFLQSL